MPVKATTVKAKSKATKIKAKTKDAALGAALAKAVAKKDVNTVKYKGETYPSLEKLAEAVGVPASTLTMRMRRGLTLKQAIEFVSKHAIKYKGQIYKNSTEFLKAQAPGVSMTSFSKCKKECEGSIAKALKLALKKQKEQAKKKAA